VRALDKTLILILNCLFILDLGISLLFIRYLYKASLKGEINYKKLYLRYKKKIVIKVIITNRLYIILYIILIGEK
jgi:hypothetical protein